MLNIAEEDYYNPTPISAGSDRKDTEANKLNMVSPALGVVKSLYITVLFVGLK